MKEFSELEHLETILSHVLQQNDSSSLNSDVLAAVNDALTASSMRMRAQCADILRSDDQVEVFNDVLQEPLPILATKQDVLKTLVRYIGFARVLESETSDEMRDVVCPLSIFPRPLQRTFVQYIQSNPHERLYYSDIAQLLYGEKLTQQNAKRIRGRIASFVSRLPHELSNYGVLESITGKGYMWIPYQQKHPIIPSRE